MILADILLTGEVRLASCDLTQAELASDFHCGTPHFRERTMATTNSLGKRGADDILEGNINDDNLHGRSNDDLLRGHGGDDALWGNRGDDRLFGGSGRDKLYGGSGRDNMWGDAGDDRLSGGVGDDAIRGGLGADVIEGGRGRDVMSGGGGKDTFVFRSASDSGLTAAKRDTITDFSRQDVIDLARIDADTTRVGNQDFRFIGDDAFTGVAGQLHYREIESGGKEFTLLEADRNGDGAADFQIALARHIHITSANLFGDL
jgi:serralysin